MYFAFTLWNSRSRKVFLDVFMGKSKSEAFTRCRNVHNSNNIMILSVVQLPI